MDAASALENQWQWLSKAAGSPLQAPAQSPPSPCPDCHRARDELPGVTMGPERKILLPQSRRCTLILWPPQATLQV